MASAAAAACREESVPLARPEGGPLGEMAAEYERPLLCSFGPRVVHSLVWVLTALVTVLVWFVGAPVT